MGVMDRYNEKKRKEQEAAAAGGLAPIGVAERYARKQNPQPVGGVETPPITVSKRSSIGAPDNYDVNIGKSGWQKYLADQERRRTDALAAEEEKTWWEKLGGYLGEVQDTTMSMGTMPSIVESYREDTSYLQPNEDWLEDEQYVFGFLYDTMGHAAAAQYADKLNAAINEEKKAAQIQRVQDAATESGWKGAAHTAGAILTAPLGLADYLDDLAQAAGRGEIREHGTITPFEYSQAATGGIANELNDVDQFGVAHKVLPEKIPVIGGKGWGDVYGLGTSIAQSALATFAGGSGQALVQFFGSAAASGVDDAINRGATAEQAVAYGTLSGIAEGLAEQIGAE